MNRRHFLRSATLASALVAPPVITAAKSSPVVKGQAANHGDNLMAQLTDDVFSRLCGAFRGRSLVRVKGWERRAPTYQDSLIDGITEQWNIGYTLYPSDVDGNKPFDWERFRDQTEVWGQGKYLCVGGWMPSLHNLQAKRPSMRDTWAQVTRVGHPALPRGLRLSEYRFDEPTGLVMRALADYSLAGDATTIRWDIIVG